MPENTGQGLLVLLHGFHLGAMLSHGDVAGRLEEARRVEMHEHIAQLALGEGGHIHAFVLPLPTSFLKDWIEKDYPIEKEH